MYRTAEFEQDLKRRSFEGFKLGEIFMTYRLIQEKNGVARIIELPYSRDTSHRDHQPFIMQPPKIAVQFSKVERILGTAIKKFNRSYRDDHAVTIRTKIEQVEGVDYEVFNRRIASSGTFDVVFDEVEKIVLQIGTPFFDKYQTLDVVFQDSEQMSAEQIDAFFEPPALVRRMIMKKLYGDPEYEAYARKMILYTKTKKTNFPLIIEALHHYLMENY